MLLFNIYWWWKSFTKCILDRCEKEDCIWIFWWSCNIWHHLINKQIWHVFYPFVEVNHHGQSTLLSCVLLSNKDTKTFIWLLTTWLECMHGRTPNAIIIDQDKVMKNAIEVVFPNACHLWCLWHLMKTVLENLVRHSDYESIKTLLHDAINLWVKVIHAKKMIKDFGLQDNKWLKGIFNERKTFWTGMSTTQRSESMNSFFMVM